MTDCMKKLLAILLLWAALPCLGNELPPPVGAALEKAGIPPSGVAILVRSTSSATPLLAHNAELPMNPASAMKLLTTYAALDLLGPAHTWKTAALADSEAADGVLAGNLYLRGSGDPRFAIEHFWALLRQLRVRGIRQIAGDIVIDRTAFAPMETPSFDDKPLRPYNVGPDAFLVNFRSLRFSVLATGAGVRLLPETPADGITIVNRLRLAEGECSDAWKDRIEIRPVLAAPGSGARLEFVGSFAASCREKTLNVAALPADNHVDSLFRALWRELGGSFDGRVRGGETPAGARLLAEHTSPPLAETLRDINKFSNNVMARQLYLALGGGGEPASTGAAARRIGHWLAGRGLDFAELELENGSGLSRRERISAASLGRLLADAWEHPYMAEFLASLPIAGVDGTMEKRLRDSPARGRVRIKSGTLDGVRSAAGYVLDRGGHPLVVVCFINDRQAASGQAIIDALLLWAAELGQ